MEQEKLERDIHLLALSIRKWWMVAWGGASESGATDCPPCEYYNDGYSCGECPINIDSYGLGCTLYNDFWVFAFSDDAVNNSNQLSWKMGGATDRLDAQTGAVAMYHYLQDLQTKLKRELAGLDNTINKD
jgi:hypothetical protein